MEWCVSLRWMGVCVSNKILYGWKSIAEYLGCSRCTAIRYRNRFGLPVKTISGRVMISIEMIEDWLRKRK